MEDGASMPLMACTKSSGWPLPQVPRSCRFKVEAIWRVLLRPWRLPPGLLSTSTNGT